MTQRRFVILDRDGTLVVEKNYLSDPDELELIAGAADAVRELTEMGLGLVVVTNQSGIGRGYFDESRLRQIHDRMNQTLGSHGACLDGIYYCPHLPQEECECRKPRPGLVFRAARDLDFDPRASFVLGDKECDIQLGRAIGATAILVRTGYGAGFAASSLVQPDHVIDSLREAPELVRGLLNQENRKTER